MNRAELKKQKEEFTLDTLRLRSMGKNPITPLIADDILQIVREKNIEILNLQDKMHSLKWGKKGKFYCNKCEKLSTGKTNNYGLCRKCLAEEVTE